MSTEDPELLSVLSDIRRDAVDVNQNLLAIQTTNTANRKILNRVQVLLFAKLITLLLLLWSVVSVANLIDEVREANKAIQDCTTPAGRCAQRNAAQLNQLTLAISYQSEAQRLTTSVLAAQALGNSDTTVPIYQRRLQEVGTILQQIRENLEDIRSDRVPRHIIPTELPVAVKEG